MLSSCHMTRMLTGCFTTWFWHALHMLSGCSIPRACRRAVLEWIEKQSVKQAVIVGGGFIGLEMAENLVRRLRWLGWLLLVVGWLSVRVVGGVS